MSTSLASYGRYQEADRKCEEGRKWHARLLDKDMHTDRHPKISPAHSSLKLSIPIQYSCGGQNYWDSPDALNAAILRVLAERPEGSAVIQTALTMMASERDQLLISSKRDLEQVMTQIAKIEERATPTP